MTIFSVAQFQDKIKIAGFTFDLSENLVSSRNGAGAVLVSSLGPRLWGGSLQLTPHHHATMNSMLSAVRQVQTAGNYFQFSPPSNDYPQSDKTGAILGTSTPVLANTASGYNLRITGLPIGYVLTSGDLFSIVQNGTSRIHQIAETAVANISGILNTTMVNPFRANSVPANGTAVKLIRPEVTCRFVPGSFKSGAISLGHVEGCSFDFIQAVTV
ncbi:hypothetical protein [Cereibacter changlensis]|uniref:hypothetical protein n=1 Tax=Cereibacter changlensis TaxID=402884 RepID=UPI0040346ACB